MSEKRNTLVISGAVLGFAIGLVIIVINSRQSTRDAGISPRAARSGTAVLSSPTKTDSESESLPEPFLSLVRVAVVRLRTGNAKEAISSIAQISNEEYRADGAWQTFDAVAADVSDDLDDLLDSRQDATDEIRQRIDVLATYASLVTDDTTRAKCFAWLVRLQGKVLPPNREKIAEYSTATEQAAAKSPQPTPLGSSTASFFHWILQGGLAFGTTMIGLASAKFLESAVTEFGKGLGKGLLSGRKSDEDQA